MLIILIVRCNSNDDNNINNDHHHYTYSTYNIYKQYNVCVCIGVRVDVRTKAHDEQQRPSGVRRRS